MGCWDKKFCTHECWKLAYREKCGPRKNAKTGPEVKCEWCGVTFRRRYKTATTSFCGLSCAAKYRRSLVGNPAQRERFLINCGECGREIERRRCEILSVNYCSRSCRSRYQTKHDAYPRTCIICEKQFTTTRTWRNKAKFCSTKCSRLANPRKVRIGKIFALEIPKVCIRCGYDDHPEIIELHHRDGDRSNNQTENLEWLCPNCHKLHHRNERKNKHQTSA